jgi:hypothetical protein
LENFHNEANFYLGVRLIISVLETQGARKILCFFAEMKQLL